MFVVTLMINCELLVEAMWLQPLLVLGPANLQAAEYTHKESCVFHRIFFPERNISVLLGMSYTLGENVNP